MKKQAKNHVIGVRVDDEKMSDINKYKIDAVTLFREALDKEIFIKRSLGGACPICGQA